MKLLNLLILVSVLLGISSCGQKGPLYLPKPSPTTVDQDKTNH